MAVNSHTHCSSKLRPQFRGQFRLPQRSSVLERLVHTQEVAGEIPAAATLHHARISTATVSRKALCRGARTVHADAVTASNNFTGASLPAPDAPPGAARPAFVGRAFYNAVLPPFNGGACGQ